MKRIFGPDSKLFSIMTMLMELAEINVMFLLCSLPIVTMGAAASSMYESLWLMQKYGEGGFSAKHFLSTFRRTLKRAAPVGCVGLLAIVLLINNLVYVAASAEGMTRLAFSAIYLILFVLIGGMLQICLFSISMAEDWNRDYVKDSFLLAVARYPYVLVNVALTASPLVILMMPGATLLRLLPLILLFWIACPAYVCVSLMVKILRPQYAVWFDKE